MYHLKLRMCYNGSKNNAVLCVAENGHQKTAVYNLGKVTENTPRKSIVKKSLFPVRHQRLTKVIYFLLTQCIEPQKKRRFFRSPYLLHFYQNLSDKYEWSFLKYVPILR